MLDREVTGRVRWLTGTAQEADDEGFDPAAGVPTGRFRATHGDFYAGARRPARAAADGHLARPDHRPSSPACRATRGPCSPGCAPTARRGAPPRSRSPGPSGALRSGLVPADLRAALYAALTALPAVSLDEHATDCDGQRRASRSCTTTGPPAPS